VPNLHGVDDGRRRDARAGPVEGQVQLLGRAIHIGHKGLSMRSNCAADPGLSVMPKVLFGSHARRRRALLRCWRPRAAATARGSNT
jgi:hypothetical protein